MTEAVAYPTLLIRNEHSGCIWWGQQDGTGFITLGNYPYNHKCAFFIVEPHGGHHYLRNHFSKFYVHGDDNGTGWIREEKTFNENCQLVAFEAVGPHWRIRNVHSHYYVHGDNDGTGSLRYDKTKNDNCQLFDFYTPTNPATA